MIKIYEQPTGADDLAYRGERLTYSGVVVQLTYIDREGWFETALDWRLDLRCHSPTGLEWGYGGSGPCQLSLALLAHALEDDAKALEHYFRFKNDVVAQLDRKGWQIRRETIRELVDTWDRQLHPVRYRESAA